MQAFRSSLARSIITVAPRRTFSVTPIASKSVTESVKDVLKGAEKAVSQKLADGIEASRMLPLSSSMIAHC